MAVRSPRLVLPVLALLTMVGVLVISCEKESPTSPTSPASAASSGKATIAGTLVNATPQGQGGDPLPGVTVRAAGTRQSTQTDEAGRFTLSDLPAGQVALEFRGPGFQSGITVNALAGQTTRVTVALNRGRSTVTLLPRSEDNRTPTPTGTITPATPRPTRTPENDDEERTRTPTLTGTITPNTPRPTRTPENEDEDRTRTPTPTGTITPAATRTPESDRD